jgi:hypothetical protein
MEKKRKKFLAYAGWLPHNSIFHQHLRYSVHSNSKEEAKFNYLVSILWKHM